MIQAVELAEKKEGMTSLLYQWVCFVYFSEDEMRYSLSVGCGPHAT